MAKAGKDMFISLCRQSSEENIRKCHVNVVDFWYAWLGNAECFPINLLMPCKVARENPHRLGLSPPGFLTPRESQELMDKKKNKIWGFSAGHQWSATRVDIDVICDYEVCKWWMFDWCLFNLIWNRSWLLSMADVLFHIWTCEPVAIHRYNMTQQSLETSDIDFVSSLIDPYAIYMHISSLLWRSAPEGRRPLFVAVEFQAVHWWILITYLHESLKPQFLRVPSPISNQMVYDWTPNFCLGWYHGALG